MTEAIVPRWEWRMFAERFGDAEQRLASLAAGPAQVSDELYVLGLGSEASVKVRDGLMDVKHLEHVDDHGLEQWRPVMKAAFPLAQADVVTVIEALGASPADLERAEYTLDELVAEVLRPRADVLALGVHKQRVRFTVEGCMAELSELRTEHGATRTVAVESEDPDRVIAAVRELGLVAPHNVSVPRKLKALAGFAARRYAVIDVGTNSVKFHIGERAADGGWRAIVDRAEVTRLGQDLERTGRLGDDAIGRTAQAINGMAEEAARHDVESIVAVGTAGLRLAPNRADLIDAVRQVHGVDVEVIPGEEEARLAYLATASELDVGDGTIVVFDTGGGSSQFTIGHGTRVEERFSLNVGAVRYMERYGLDGLVDEATLAAALDAIAADLARLDGLIAVERVVGMGGAVTNLAAVKHGLADYDPDVVQGTVLDNAEIDRQIELYRTRDAEERRQIVGLQANRAAVILAGACIVRGILTKLGRDTLTVSDRGLRHGLVVERFAHSARERLRASPTRAHVTSTNTRGAMGCASHPLPMRLLSAGVQACDRPRSRPCGRVSGRRRGRLAHRAVRADRRGRDRGRRVRRRRVARAGAAGVGHRRGGAGAEGGRHDARLAVDRGGGRGRERALDRGRRRPVHLRSGRGPGATEHASVERRVRLRHRLP